MNPIVVVGDGAFVRQVAEYAVYDPETRQPDRRVAGFLSFRGEMSGAGCLGRVADYAPGRHERFVCALRDPLDKAEAMGLLRSRGACFASVIHPSAVVSESARWGEGVVFFPKAVIGAGATAGDFATIQSGLGHDTRVGAFSTVESGCDLTGGVSLGDGVWVGVNAMIVPHRMIGEWSRIAAGSMVVRHVKPHTVVGGYPARRWSGSEAEAWAYRPI